MVMKGGEFGRKRLIKGGKKGTQSQRLFRTRARGGPKSYADCINILLYCMIIESRPASLDRA